MKKPEHVVAILTLYPCCWMNGKHKCTVSLHFSKFHLNANFFMPNEQQNHPQTSPSLWGDLDPLKYTILFLADPTHHPKPQLDCFTWFYRAMPQILQSLQWVAHYAPPKLPLSMEGLGPPFNTFFLEQPNPLPKMAFQLPQPFFQNTRSFPTDLQTDQPTEPTQNSAYINSW